MHERDGEACRTLHCRISTDANLKHPISARALPLKAPPTHFAFHATLHPHATHDDCARRWGAQASPSFSLLSEAMDLMKMRLLDFLVVRG